MSSVSAQGGHERERDPWEPTPGRRDRSLFRHRRERTANRAPWDLECCHSPMPADTRRATTFLLAALAWSLGLFALLRSSVGGSSGSSFPSRWCRSRRPTTTPAALRCPWPSHSSAAGPTCSRCVWRAILACPVSWRARLAGAAGAVAFVLGLNTVRIATLGRAAASPDLFRALHLQVWPAILVLATAGYVLAWMRTALERATARTERVEEGTEAGALSPLVRRFAPRAAVLLVAFALCGPWIARSEALLEAGAWTARAAAVILTAAGLPPRRPATSWPRAAGLSS